MNYDAMLAEKDAIIAQLQAEQIQSAERYIQLLKDQNELLRQHHQVLHELAQLKKSYLALSGNASLLKQIRINSPFLDLNHLLLKQNPFQATNT